MDAQITCIQQHGFYTYNHVSCKPFPLTSGIHCHPVHRCAFCTRNFPSDIIVSFWMVIINDDEAPEYSILLKDIEGAVITVHRKTRQAGVCITPLRIARSLHQWDD